jgi:hypothetical protein
MISWRAGALAEMCGAAKHKRVKLSVNAAIASMTAREALDINGEFLRRKRLQ